MNTPPTQNSSKLPVFSIPKTLKDVSRNNHDSPQDAPRECVDVLAPHIFEGLIRKTPFITFSPKTTSFTKEVFKEIPKEVPQILPKEVAHDPPKQVATEISKHNPLESIKEPSKEPSKEPPKGISKKPPPQSKSPVKGLSRGNSQKKTKPTPLINAIGSGTFSPQNFGTEPSSPAESRESTPDKNLYSSKSLGSEKVTLHSILKRREKSRFSIYNKLHGKNLRQSSPKVIIVEGLYGIETNGKARFNF